MLNPIDMTKVVDSEADKRVVEVYEYLKRYRDKDTARETWYEENYKKPWEAAFENKLWNDDELKAMKDKGQIPLTINDMAKGIQGSSAVITASKPGIQINPIGMNDLYVSELLQRGVTNVWDQTKCQKRLFKVVAHCKTGTIGCIDISYDKAKGMFGRTVVKNFRPDILFWDKDSEEDDLSDVHIIKARLITKTYAKENYEGITDEDLTFDMVDKSDEDGGKSSGVSGEDNYAIETSKGDGGGDKAAEEKKDIWEIEAHLLKRVDKWCVTVTSLQDPDAVDKKFCASEEEAKAMMFDIATKDPNTMMVVDKNKCEVRIHRIIVGKKLISEEENPYGIDSNYEPVLPLIVLQHDETLTGYPTGPSVRALELSKERNKRRMQSIYVVTKNLDAPIVMPEGFKWVKDEKHGDMLQIPKDTPFQPQRLLPGTTPQEAMLLEKQVQEDIKTEYDTQDVMVGKMPANEISGRAMLALQDMGSMMSKPFIEKVEDCAVRIAKVIISIITRHWPRKMWERLIEADEWGSWQPDKEVQTDEQGKPVEPNPEEVQNKWKAAIDLIMSQKVGLVNVDVKVTAGSTLPTNRMAKRADAIEMVKAGIYDQEAALDYVDDPYKDAVKDRISQKAQGNSAVEKFNMSLSIKSEDLPSGSLPQILEKYAGIEVEQPQIGTAGATSNEMMQGGVM